MVRWQGSLLRLGALATLWLVSLVVLPLHGHPAALNTGPWVHRSITARRGLLMQVATARLSPVRPGLAPPRPLLAPPRHAPLTRLVPHTRHLPPLARLSSSGARIVRHTTGTGILPATDPLVADPLISHAQESQGFAPPDTQIAVGDGIILEMVNDTVGLWTTSGMFLLQGDLNAFFPVPNGYLFSDPQVLYDAASARWFASGLAYDNAGDSQSYLAVSETADPQGLWRFYTLASYTGIVTDQPTLGVSSALVTLSWDDFTSAGFSGQETWVLSKADTMAGGTIHDGSFYPDATRFHIVPTRMLGDAAVPILVYTGQDIYADWYLGVVQLMGDPATGMTWNETDLPISTLTLPPTATQPSGGPPLDTADNRVLSASWQNGVLWAALDDGCVPTGDSALHSCLRLIQASVAGATATLLQDFDAAAVGADLFYPAVTMDGAGNLFVVYSASSPTLYASVGVTGQQTTWAANTLAAFQTLQAGSGLYDCGACAQSTPDGADRWGDYSAAVPDPSDSTGVWLAGEYAASSSDVTDWGTAAGDLTFSVPPPTATPSATPTATATASATDTASPTPSATASSTPTETATTTSTDTPNPSATPTETTIPSATATATQTAPPSPSPTTATETPTPETAGTTTPQPTATATVTPPVASATPTPPTASPTAIDTATASPTGTATPTASDTPTNVPPTATATSTSNPPTVQPTQPPPTTTSGSPPSPTPTSTSRPAATSTPVPPAAPTATATAVARPIGAGSGAPPTPTATATVTSNNQAHPSSPPHRRRLMLALTVTPGRVRSGTWLTVRAHTVARTHLLATLQVTRRVTIWVGRGHRRHRQTRTVVLFSLVVARQAGPRGNAVWRIRVSYTPRQPSGALVIVTVPGPRRSIMAQAHMPITILPPTPHHAPKGHSRKGHK